MRFLGKFLTPVMIVLLSALPARGADKASATATNHGEAADFQADSFSFDNKTNLRTGKGDVVVRYKDAVVRADEAKFNSLTKEIWATGNVRLYRRGEEWSAPAAYYNFETRTLKTDDANGFFYPIYLHAEHVSQIASNHYQATRTTATTCDYDHAHYRFQAESADVYPSDRVVMHNCTVRLGDVPVAWFPAMTFSLKGDMEPFSIAAGKSSRWGFYLLTTTNWRLNEHLRLSTDIDERARRGFGTGGTLKYDYGTDNSGALRAYYTSDARPWLSTNNLPIVKGTKLDTNRFITEWQHKEFFDENLSLTVDLNRQSDAYVVQEFFGNEFKVNREPASVADVTRRGENYTLSLMAQPQFNRFFAEVERLPEVKWSVNRMRVGPTPLFYEGQSSVGYYNNHQGDTTDPLFNGESLRVDTLHQLVSPWNLFGWLNIIPRAGGRYTYYERAPNSAPDTNEVKRFVGNLGTDISFKLSRTWDNVQNPRLGINGLRHIIEPFADYSWIPTPNVRSNALYQFDTVRSLTLTNGERLPVTRYLPLDFPANTEVESIGRENVMRFGLRTRLQTRRDNRPWDLVDLTAWTDLNIEKTEGQHRFSDLFGWLKVRPTDWLGLDTFSRYDMQAGILREFNSEVRVNNADKWAVGVGTRYLRDDSNQIAVDLTYRLARNWVAQVYQRVEMQDGNWEEQDYLLRQEMHDWYISYGCRYRNPRIGRSDASFYISFTLKAYPGVKVAVNRVDLGTGE